MRKEERREGGEKCGREGQKGGNGSGMKFKERRGGGRGGEEEGGGLREGEEEGQKNDQERGDVGVREEWE